jgi:pyruvate dehydrogenase E2 component (dihydrolipoamide acetyltransferase)
MNHRVIMPDLGQTAAEGKILRWLKKPGDRVAKGEALFEVETDKVTMEVESYQRGYLRALLVGEGQMASAMSPIAILTDSPEEVYEGSDVPGGHTTLPQKSNSETANLSGSGSGASVLSGLAPQSRPSATPAARAHARELGLQLDRLAGTGPGGLVTRRDVQAALIKEQSSNALSPMAAMTAKSVADIPHFYLTVDVNVSGLLNWRSHWNHTHPDLRASVNDIFVRAAALALKDVPHLNVRYSEGKVERQTRSDVLLVVASDTGLTLVPVRDPAASPWEIYLKDMRIVLEDARQNRVKASLDAAPALGVSNLGMFGVKQFTAIIPPGCGAVLALGAIREELAVKDKQMRFEDMCSLTLGSDHRVIDGVTAAKFLQRIQAHLNSL